MAALTIFTGKRQREWVRERERQRTGEDDGNIMYIYNAILAVVVVELEDDFKRRGRTFPEWAHRA